MVITVFLLFVGLGVLTAGADFLVRGSSSLAQRLGLSSLVVGLTIVAFGTSSPELVVSLRATLHDQGDIAIGNVVGSNIFNIGVILGLSAVIMPLKVNLAVLKVDAPLVIVASLVAAALIHTGTIGRAAGAILVTALAVYTVVTIRVARREPDPAIAEEFDAGTPVVQRHAGLDVLLILAGLAGLVTGAALFVDAAANVARALGVSEAVIGLTIVAAGTSMPELATSAVAAMRRQVDIAVGNVLGSNLFNILGILGITSVVRPLQPRDIGTVDVLAMVGFAVALLPLLWTQSRLSRLEGVMLLGGYGIYLAMLWPT